MIDTNDDAAARWASKLDDGLADAEQEALQDWLDGDSRRAGALLRAEACLSLTRRLRATAPDTSMVDDAMPSVSRRSMIGRMVTAGGIAVAAAGAGVLLWPAGGATYRTAVGEVRRVPLADGSIASINTASSLRVAIGEQQRTVMLDRGEAWFQVAHDPSRPFIVEAGSVEVRAVGTAFSMRRRDDGVDLLVTEGVVEARTGAGDAATTLRVKAGETAYLSMIAKSRPPAAGTGDVERALAWRHGEIALEGQTLGEAAAEINRYNVVQISVDRTIADQQFVGYFRTNDPLAFARTVATVSGAKVTEDAGNIRIVKN